MWNELTSDTHIGETQVNTDVICLCVSAQQKSSQMNKKKAAGNQVSHDRYPYGGGGVSSFMFLSFVLTLSLYPPLCLCRHGNQDEIMVSVCVLL